MGALPCRKEKMSNVRAVLVALFATAALVSCQVPENAVVGESEPLVEALVQLPGTSSSTKAEETDEPNYTTTTDSDESNSHAGPANGHDEEECAHGLVLCSNGACAEKCDPSEEATSLHDYVFAPKYEHLGAPPKVAGRQTDYVAEANNYQASQTEAEQRAVTAAEQSAGLGFASHDAALDEETHRNQAKKLEVEKLMNTAAAHAAEFKKKTEEHDVSVANVKTAKIQEQKQEAIVATAKATLQQEEDNLKKAQEHVTAMENEEQNRRYQAEFAGQGYEHAKAAAIKADNDLQESIHETEEKDKFRQVAREAVEKAAKAELKAVHEKAESPAAPTPAEAKCEDCVELPEMYTSAGGTCSDCAQWAKDGQCDEPQYKQFMRKYCAKSCGCPASSAVEVATKLVMPAKK